MPSAETDTVPVVEFDEDVEVDNFDGTQHTVPLPPVDSEQAGGSASSTAP